MKRSVGALLVGTAAGMAGLGAGVAAQRYAVRRIRAGPDAEAGEDLAERPGRERRAASFDGTGLAVNVAGPAEGPTVVFVHGFSLDMTVWHYQWKRLSERYRCVLFDQRGHGRSDVASGGDYSLEALGRDLKAILDALAPEPPVVLVGHSMGGMAIMSFAALYPEEFGPRVGGVVLANTAAAEIFKEILGGLGGRLGAFFVPYPRAVLGEPGRLYRLRSRSLQHRIGLAFLVARFSNFGPGAPPSLVDHVLNLAARTPPGVWTDVFRSMMEMDLGHALRHITVPALVVVGDVDRLTPPSSALAIKRMLPEARMVVMRGAGHCAMLERHEQFTDLLEEFLGGALAPGPEAVARASTPMART